jgi:hypothetical protein
VEAWLDDVAALAADGSLAGDAWAYRVNDGGQVADTSPAAAGLSGLRRPVPAPGVRVAVDRFERVRSSLMSPRCRSPGMGGRSDSRCVPQQRAAWSER